MDALLIGFQRSFNGIKAVWSYNVLIFFCPCSNLQRWRFIFHFMFSMKLGGSKANGSWQLVSHSHGCSCALRMWVPGNSMLRDSKVGTGDFCGLISPLASRDNFCWAKAAAVANQGTLALLALGPGDLFWQVLRSSEHCEGILQLLLYFVGCSFFL